MTDDTFTSKIFAGTPRHAGGRYIIPVILKHRWSSGRGMFVSETPLGVYVIEGEEECYFPFVPEEAGYSDAENFEEILMAVRADRERVDQ